MNIFAVMVVFNRKIEETKTLRSLLRNYAKNPQVFTNFKLIIYDNSSRDQSANPIIPFQCEYVHDSENSGLVKAYNYALKKAIATFHSWLLILDQDSSLPEDFISRLFVDLAVIKDDNAVAAVVPRSRYRKIIFSPLRDLYGGILRPVDMRHKGVCAFKVSAVGSGSAIKVSFLQSAGGFNEIYWLDGLDRWLFNAINNMGGKVYVADSIIDHELSIMDYDKFMDEQRYANILKYEAIFMKSFKSKAENYVYYLRLLMRAIYLFITVNNKRYSLMTLCRLKDAFLPS